jgi:PiT family inorganic phosphate transporter
LLLNYLRRPSYTQTRTQTRTHTLVGAVLGVSFARGIGALNLRTVSAIFLSWIITLPAGAGLVIIFFFIFKGIFGT